MAITLLQQKENWEVGEQVLVPLMGLGKFTVTVYEVTEKSVLFIFDDYVTSRPMNAMNTNKGGYEASDLKTWMDTELLAAFPEGIRNDIFDLTIPSVGQMFGHEDEWNESHFEPDEDEQLELMKFIRYRIAYYNNDFKWGWLRNAAKNSVVSSSSFALAYGNGRASGSNASNSFGVRPVFRLARKPERALCPEDKVRSKQYPRYVELAKDTREWFDAYVEAGFTEEQAFNLLIATSR